MFPVDKKMSTLARKKRLGRKKVLVMPLLTYKIKPNGAQVTFVTQLLRLGHY